MKKLIFLFLGLAIISCGGTDSSPLKTIEKKIYQSVDASGMGMLENLNITSVEATDSPETFMATHTFTNPMTKKEMRITRNYVFNTSKDSILSKEDILVEMKSAGEWVKFGK